MCLIVCYSYAFSFGYLFCAVHCGCLLTAVLLSVRICKCYAAIARSSGSSDVCCSTAVSGFVQALLHVLFMHKKKGGCSQMRLYQK